MAAVDARFQTNKATVWRRAGVDAYGVPSYNLLGVFGATWKAGSRMVRDDNGTEFVPRDEIFIDSTATVLKGDLIFKGDNSGAVEAAGDIVRVVKDYDNSFFGWSNSLVVMTE